MTTADVIPESKNDKSRIKRKTLSCETRVKPDIRTSDRYLRFCTPSKGADCVVVLYA